MWFFRTAKDELGISRPRSATDEMDQLEGRTTRYLWWRRLKGDFTQGGLEAARMSFSNCASILAFSTLLVISWRKSSMSTSSLFSRLRAPSNPPSEGV
jgi:hypothetical protein